MAGRMVQDHTAGPLSLLAGRPHLNILSIYFNQTGRMAGSEITKALLCRCFVVDWAVLSAVCVLPGLRAVGN